MRTIIMLVILCMTLSMMGQNRVSGIEYWFDQQHATRQFKSLTGTDEFIYTIQTLAVGTVAPGYHTINLRLKDTEGVWSSVTSKRVFIHPPLENKITSLRIWSDPISNPSDLFVLPITPEVKHLYISQVLDLCQLDNTGPTRVFFQLGDNNGNWSSVTSKTINVDVIGQPPATIGDILGPEFVCFNTTQNYSVNPVQGASQYHWTTPLNWDPSTVFNTLTILPDHLDGIIDIYASNACGNSDTNSIFIEVHSSAPSHPDSIFGEVKVCAGEVITYSIDSIPEATNYTWSFPPSWTIENIPTPLSYVVIAGNQPGNISVVASNSCGNSESSSIQVFVTPQKPSTPSFINETEYVCTDSLITYSVSDDPLAESFHWNFPADWTVLDTISPNQLQFLTGGLGGLIEVSASNICGVSDIVQLQVHTSQDIPFLPDTISGNPNPCKGSTEAYSIPVGIDASSITWDVPDGWSILSNPDSSYIFAHIGSLGGTLSVSASNGCGESNLSMNISVPTIITAVDTQDSTLMALETNAIYQWLDCTDGSPIAGATNALFMPSISGEYQVIIQKEGCTDTSECYTIIVTATGDINLLTQPIIYPNPSNGSFFVSHPEFTPRFVLFDVLGRTIPFTSKVMDDRTMITMEENVPGLYYLEIHQQAKLLTIIPLTVHPF